MLTYAQASELAAAWIRIVCGDNVRLIEASVVKKPYGWVFYYQSAAFLETKNPLEMLAGNAPLLVNQIDGEIRVIGTSQPLEHYLTDTRPLLQSHAWR